MDGLILLRLRLKNSDISTRIANVQYTSVQKELNPWTRVVSKKTNSGSAGHKILCTLWKVEVIHYADKGSPVEPVPSQIIPVHTHKIANYFPNINFNNILSSMSNRYTCFPYISSWRGKGQFHLHLLCQVLLMCTTCTANPNFPACKNPVI